MPLPRSNDPGAGRLRCPGRVRGRLVLLSGSQVGICQMVIWRRGAKARVGRLPVESTDRVAGSQCQNRPRAAGLFVLRDLHQEPLT